VQRGRRARPVNRAHKALRDRLVSRVSLEPLVLQVRPAPRERPGHRAFKDRQVLPE
jgi:hypothetical protein